VAVEPARDPVVRILRRVRPLGSLPIAARYGLTCVFVAICFGINLLLAEHEPYPYIAFFPAILASSSSSNRSRRSRPQTSPNGCPCSSSRASAC
jgi:hypothetical protein